MGAGAVTITGAGAVPVTGAGAGVERSIWSRLLSSSSGGGAVNFLSGDAGALSAPRAACEA